MTATGIQRRKIEMLLDEVEHLPTLPGVAVHAIALATADRPSPRDIQLALEVDPTLAARALRLAVDLAAPPEALGAIDDVLAHVPTDALACEMLSVGAVEPDLVERVGLRRLWRHSLATAMAAQVIATRIGTVAPGRALLAALLHDLGQIALRVLMPKAYAQVLERLEAGGGDLLEAERDLLGVDHAVLGRRLAQRWGFPETIADVLWLHHQAQVPAEARPAAGTLTQVVRLADLLARQQGFGYYASEQIAENPADLAERLGLSGVQAEQVGRQIGPALDLNARPAGLDDDPAPEVLARAIAGANARLGRAHRTAFTAVEASRRESAAARVLVDLGARLAACHTARQVLERVALAARDALACQVAVPYVAGADGAYVEGVRCTARGGIEEHFLYDLASAETLEPAPEPVAGTGGPALARAERVEGWLFERQGPHLGTGPFYTAAMTAGDAKVGGLVFTLGRPPREPTPHEAAQVLGLAAVAGIALKRVQAEADLVALSEELATANRQLEAAHRAHLQQESVAALSAMATGAAHEINNPLAVISGRAQQLAADEKDPGRRQLLETVVQQAARISAIIAELQAFARPPAPQVEAVEAAALAEGAAESLRSAAEAAGVRLGVEADPAAPALRVDPEQVSGALREVVRNGVEAVGRAGGGTVRILVQALRAPSAVRFTVTDDGPGMAPEVRARAFDPFFSGREAGRGRGLGLAKAYRAVQANGGQMALESAPGAGTTVRMTFPAAAAVESPAADESVQA